MILVTGCTGYLGFHICEYLNDNKIPFFGIDNLSRSSKYNIFDKNKFLKIDISSKKIPKILAKKKIHSVIHAAAYSFPPESEDNKKIYYKNNILKTKIFINYCSNHKIEKFIFFSSSNVYKFNFRKISAVKENQKLKPSNYYGKTKLIIEKYLKKKKYNNYSILRLSKTYGDQIDDNTLFSNILKTYLNGVKKFEIAHDQYFRPLYINDLIKIIDCFLKNRIVGVFNVCGDQYLSRYNLIKKMFETLKIKDVIINKCSLSKFNKKVSFPKKLNLSNNKIKNKIGIKFTNFEKILKRINV